MDNKSTPLSRMKDALNKALQSHAHQSEGSRPIVINPELIASTVSWMRFGTIKLSTGKSENVQEIHFDSPLGTAQNKF